MDSIDFKRKLTAILSADVAGYSRLMGEDEEGTVLTLNKYKEIIFGHIKGHHGRLVDSPGDNVLAEFSSVVDAVKCAVQIQKDLKVGNEALPQNRKMEFRIGINIGDVIQDGDRIYGDGVNVAARIESLADPSGICISRTAYDQVKTKIPIDYEYLGEYEVKNIKEPVRVYKVLMDLIPDKVIEELKSNKTVGVNSSKKKSIKIPIAIISIILLISAGLFLWKLYQNQHTKTEQSSVVFNEKQSPKTIAVLPFENLSSDPEQEYFSDGLTEELINKLSQVKDLQVTAHTSSFYFKGKDEDMRTIGEILGVEYLLEGSVRKTGNQLRITAQLIKAKDGYHLLSETYDRELKDIFNIQDEIAKAVNTALSVTLGVGDFNRPGMTRNIEAYDEYLRANVNWNKYTPTSILSAIDQYKKALDIDPDFGLCWANLYVAYVDIMHSLPPSQTSDFKTRKEEAMKRAMAIAPDMPDLLLAKAYYEYTWSGKWLEVERIYRQIFDKQGHANSDVNASYGRMLINIGRCNDSLPYLQRAKRLDPLSGISFNLSLGLNNAKRLNDALMEVKRGQSLKESNNALLTIEFFITLENNDRHRAATILTKYNIEGDPYATMLKAPEILLMKDRGTALSNLKELSKRSDISNNHRGWRIATIASVLGDPELAFENLVKPKENICIDANFWLPLHHGVRQLSAFKKYIRDIGLYDYWRTTGNWGDFCKPVGDNDFECE
jgi:adenylate cyclase